MSATKFELWKSKVKKSLLLPLLSSVLAISACSEDDENIPSFDTQAAIDVSRGDYTCYEMVTSMGNISLAIDDLHAPITADNFKQYVDSGFYQGTIFHRVMKGFVAQGGGFTDTLARKETLTPIKLESKNGLKNYRGRIAMARTNVQDSATSQFYINLVDNHSLNYSSQSAGYAVFGGVIEGMDVVDAIANVEVGPQGMHSHVPDVAVTIDFVDQIECQ